MSDKPLFKTASFQNFNDYKQINDFVNRKSLLTLSSLEKAVINEVNLFAIPQDYNFETLNSALDEIIKTLPYIKNIFARPITHIKSEREIVPVEAMRSITNDTISHIIVHSELWQNIENGNLRPRKLLSETHIDNYAIYENVIFTRFIDYLLLFVNRNITFLNNILYSNKNLQFNLLERENHLSYFLAIGKLHTGYVRDYAKYSILCESCLEKLKFVNRVLKAGTVYPVYRRCKKSTAKLALKKTNIFRNDKDYGRIYRLIKYFASKEENMQALYGTKKQAAENDGYFDYCTLITLFAISHFNFTFDESSQINLRALDLNAAFKDFKLNIKSINGSSMTAIRLTVCKDKEYSIILMPQNLTDANRLENARQRFKANEYKLLSGFEQDNSTLLLSLYDIESFRKIQQLILKAMVYADKTYNICPFCGEELRPDGNTRFCKACRTEIKESLCPKTELPYKSVSIKNLNITPQGTRRDAAMHFRNITEISDNADIICPHCGQIHNI